MPEYNLKYFDIRGLAETIRLLLLDNSIKFKDEPVKDWPATKGQMLFGQMPCLETEDGAKMFQTTAILRYLAREHGLYGKDSMAMFVADMWNDAVDDVKKKYLTMIYQNYEGGKDEYIKSIPALFNVFEVRLGETKAFLAGENITFGDYNFFNVIDCNEILAPGALDGLTNVKAYFNRMAERPGIKAYRQSEDFKRRPLNGNGKQ